MQARACWTRKRPRKGCQKEPELRRNGKNLRSFSRAEPWHRECHIRAPADERVYLLSPLSQRRIELRVGKGNPAMKPLSPARKASLGMTAVLGIAVAAGAGSALFNAHAAPVTPVRPESRAPAAQARPSTPTAGEDSTVVTGSVLETLAASRYTYLRLATESGEMWTAVPSATVAVGAKVDRKSTRLNSSHGYISYA